MDEKIKFREVICSHLTRAGTHGHWKERKGHGLKVTGFYSRHDFY